MSSESNSRRRFLFGCLLVAVIVLAALVTAAVVPLVRRSSAEDRAVSEIERNGGTARRLMLWVHYVDFQPEVGDTEFAQSLDALSEFTFLEQLNLSGTRVTDTSLIRLCRVKLPNLNLVDLRGTSVSDEAVLKLKATWRDIDVFR